ncbi:nitrogen fixation protein NifQ, partial [Salmonella enterica subsp. enterica serovar Montevideo]|nr:nitrogen fixation protein NifQ [Salmonella enterica subsp. enterica serovar Montevideo]
MIAAQASRTDMLSFPLAGAVSGETHAGRAFSRLLTGHEPAEADIDDNDDFDRHVLASILAAAVMDGGSFAERVGLDEQQLNELLAECFPSAQVR